MEQGYNGWSNWETWNFFLHEEVGLEMVIQPNMTLEEVQDAVWSYIGFLAESEQMEELPDITREFAFKAFEAVDTDEIAAALHENICEE